MPTKCFMIEPTNKYRRSLRRYSSGSKCDKGGYHQAKVVMDEVKADEHPVSGDIWAHNDERWPVSCPCGYEFADEDSWQLFIEQVYVRNDTGEEMTLSDAPPGAMWDAKWMSFKGPDGRCIVVRLPNGGDWLIDSRASNCKRPEDKAHKCWVREGSPPMLTVSKNGNTCATGTGSIIMNANGVYYHGVLREGVLT